MNFKTQNGADQERPLTRKETAEMFAVSLNCLNDWTNKGILTAYKIGRRTYYNREECLKVLFNSKRA